MNLAVSTLFCLDKPLEEAFLEIKSLDIKRIEIADSGYHTLNQSRIYRLQKLLIENKLEFSIHAPYADTNLSADDRSIREAIINRIKKSIDYAKELNAKTLVFHPGWRTPIDGFIPNHSWSLNLKSIRKLTRYAQDLDVIALVENLPDPRDFLLKSQDEFNNFFDETDFDVSMVLDIGHANIRGEIFDFIENFAEKIKHIHVSDNYGEKDQHLKIGDGTINWDKVISKLKECGFDGWIVIESYNGVKESIDYLRKRCYNCWV